MAVYSVSNDGVYKYGYIDKSGTPVIEAVYDVAYPFAKSGLAAFRIKTDKLSCGYLNTKGEIVIEPIFSYLSPGSTFCDDGYAVAWTEDGCGVIDATGSFLFEPSNDYHSIGEQRHYALPFDPIGTGRADQRAGYTEPAPFI